jgi:hypothetical protein
MIQVIVFSFDRAMQLDLLLCSIEKFDTHRLFSVCVLFACSSDEYQIAYDRLKNKYPTVCWMQEQRYEKAQLNFHFNFTYWHNLYWWLKSNIVRKNKSNFKSCLLKIVNNSRFPFVMFLTDDSLFYNEISISQTNLDKIKQQPEVYSFSFRHGMNLRAGIYQERIDSIYWNVYENDVKTDWGYPFSVDGHVYETQTIHRIVNKLILNNPNTMEANIACYVSKKNIFPHIIASKQSSLVGFELNRVQSVTNNHHLSISQKELNYYYLEGYTLKIDFNKTNVNYFRPPIQSLSVEKRTKKIEIWNPKGQIIN